jgi:uncharacterized protein (TIGR00730 family)
MKILRKKIDRRISPKHFHVTIFGSSRVKKSDLAYKHVYHLAKKIGERDIDVITGGGPGIMEAANRGHQKGAKGTTSHSIGLGIKLPHEQGFNKSVQLYREFKTFSRRLDNFMLMSNAIVIAPGGVGTMLELLYSWQLMQVGHTCNIPVILLGDMWKGFISWLKKEPLKHKYFEKKDLDLLYFAKNSEEAMEIIEKAYEAWAKGGKNICLNYKKYQIRT